MISNKWFDLLKSAKKTAIIQDGRKKVHFLFNDGKELVEEYNLDTNIVVKRAWREKGNLGQDIGWTVEIGDPEPQKSNNFGVIDMKESSNTPFVTRRITKTYLEWRIRNLPYSKDVFDVTVGDDHTIVIKTTNKKYYKKLTVPDLERIGLKPIQENISFTHQFNTLIIKYKKPLILIKLEEDILKEIQSIKIIKENNPQCPTS